MSLHLMSIVIDCLGLAPKLNCWGSLSFLMSSIKQLELLLGTSSSLSMLSFEQFEKLFWAIVFECEETDNFARFNLMDSISSAESLKFSSITSVSGEEKLNPEKMSSTLAAEGSGVSRGFPKFDDKLTCKDNWLICILYANCWNAHLQRFQIFLHVYLELWTLEIVSIF